MCRMNQQKWSDLYEERLRNPALMQERQVFENAKGEAVGALED